MESDKYPSIHFIASISSLQFSYHLFIFYDGLDDPKKLFEQNDALKTQAGNWSNHGL